MGTEYLLVILCKAENVYFPQLFILKIFNLQKSWNNTTTKHLISVNTHIPFIYVNIVTILCLGSLMIDR